MQLFQPALSVTHLTISAQPGRFVYFVSDVHLGYGSRSTDADRERLLVRLLERFAHDAAHIFIVGDLFDAWFDYRTVVPKHHVRTLAALASLRDAHIPITYLMGNHDFGHHTFFSEELGIHVVGGDVDATIGTTKFYVAHGDGKAAADTGYLVLRAILRNRVAQALYRWIHPDIGIAVASGTSHGSRDITSRREIDADDGLRAFAIDKLRQGFDVVVMGHRHQVHSEESNGGLYINLGHWLCDEPTFGVFDPATQRIRPGHVRTWLRSGSLSLV